MIKITNDMLKPFLASPKLRQAALRALNIEVTKQVLQGKRLFGNLESGLWAREAGPGATHICTAIAIEEIPKKLLIVDEVATDKNQLLKEFEARGSTDEKA